MMVAVFKFQEVLLQFLDLIDYLICLPLALIFSKLSMASILKKLEMGVFFFCWRQALLAEEEAPEYAEFLREQAESEYSHCTYFASLEGNEVSLDTDDLFAREQRAINWSVVDWNGDEKYQADGLSCNFLAGKIFFMGRTANSFSFQEKLAFMLVLERFQTIFYRAIAPYFPEDEREQIIKISISESLHSTTIESEFRQIINNDFLFFIFIAKWQILKYLALLVAPIDCLYLLKKQ